MRVTLSLLQIVVPETRADCLGQRLQYQSTSTRRFPMWLGLLRDPQGANPSWSRNSGACAWRDGARCLHGAATSASPPSECPLVLAAQVYKSTALHRGGNTMVMRNLPQAHALHANIACLLPCTVAGFNNAKQDAPCMPRCWV